MAGLRQMLVYLLKSGLGFGPIPALVLMEIGFRAWDVGLKAKDGFIVLSP